MSDPIADRFRDLSIDAFVDRLASSAPAPGGGAASAIAGSLGAALVTMVAGLSEGRERYAAHAATHAWAKARGTELADRLLRIADDDAAAYDAFGGAMKLPRATEAEQANRTAAIQAAARVAAEVPLTCVEACLELVTAADALAGRSNRNASSDLSVASLLAEAAATGAAENVLVNLPSLGDEVAAAALRARTETTLAEVRVLAAAVRGAVESKVERDPIPGGIPG